MVASLATLFCFFFSYVLCVQQQRIPFCFALETKSEVVNNLIFIFPSRFFLIKEFKKKMIKICVLFNIKGKREKLKENTG